MRHEAKCQCCGRSYTFGAIFRPFCLSCTWPNTEGTAVACTTPCKPGVPTYVEQVQAWAKANNVDQW